MTKTKNMVRIVALINSHKHFNDMTKNQDTPAEEYGTFLMTTILIKRVRELINGAPSLIETASSDPVKAAFEEYASGKLNLTDNIVTEED